MELVKIYDKTCDICSMLAGIDEEIAQTNGFFFRQITTEDLAKNPSHIRDYIIPVYVTPNDGMIDLPIYLLITQQGEIQASGEVHTVEELNNLIQAWQIWESSKSA